MEIFSLQALLFFYALSLLGKCKLSDGETACIILDSFPAWRVSERAPTLLCSCVMIPPYCQAHIIVKYETNLLWWRRRRRRALNNNNDDRERPVWEKSVARRSAIPPPATFLLFFSFVSHSVCVARSLACVIEFSGARVLLYTNFWAVICVVWYEKFSWKWISGAGREIPSLALLSPYAPMTQESIYIRVWICEIS